MKISEINGRLFYSAGAILFVLLFLNSFRLSQTTYLETYKKEVTLMGSPFEIIAVSHNPKLADIAIKSGIQEIERIEKLISSWDSTSETSAIVRNAGIQPMIVSEELFELIRRSIKVSELTQGAFDISFASINHIWKFDGSMTEIPSEEELKQSVAKINYQNIILDSESRSVFLKEQGMRIGFGAIGKGYAANKARDVMKSIGIESGIVNAGGDLITWGTQGNGKPWSIGIADPKNKDKVFSWIEVNETAVVTSGNYERFAMIDGKRYAHIIHPKTGWPVSGIKSVSVITIDAELADALATSVFVMGEEEGLNMINQVKGVECIIINDQDSIMTSENLSLNYYSNEEKQKHNFEIK